MSEEISLTEIKSWERSSYDFLDIREENVVAYGKIPGAKTIPFS